MEFQPVIQIILCGASLVYPAKVRRAMNGSTTFPSRELRAEALLKHARLEWSVESMHWLLKESLEFSPKYHLVKAKTVTAFTDKHLSPGLL
jgi:hypothetical protein